MIQLPIALQAYSLRRIYEDNPLRALKLIREAGYDGVELYGTHFQTELYPALLREAGERVNARLLVGQADAHPRAALGAGGRGRRHGPR